MVYSFKEAVKAAADNDIKLAIENQIDFTGEEALSGLRIIKAIYTSAERGRTVYFARQYLRWFTTVKQMLPG